MEGETAMASVDRTRALTRVPPAADKATEIRTVLAARDKEPGIMDKLAREFRSEAMRVTREVVGQEAEQFDFDNFVSKWKPVAEQFQERRTLLASFFSQLAACLASYENEDAEELLRVLEQQRDAWAQARREQYSETEEISKKIDVIDQQIAALQEKLYPSWAVPGSAPPREYQEPPPTPESGGGRPEDHGEQADRQARNGDDHAREDQHPEGHGK
jgi:hypothetical protein